MNAQRGWNIAVAANEALAKMIDFDAIVIKKTELERLTAEIERLKVELQVERFMCYQRDQIIKDLRNRLEKP